MIFSYRTHGNMDFVFGGGVDTKDSGFTRCTQETNWDVGGRGRGVLDHARVEEAAIPHPFPVFSEKKKK